MNFLENYKKCWNFLDEIKWYAVFILGVFCFFVILGFAFPIFFREEIFAFIRELMLRLEGKSVLELISYIFFNNLRASFFAFLLGVVFGIFPLAVAVVNGYLLGFISYYSATQGGLLILLRILPHGIFELPAFFLSVGIGLKIGLEVLKKDAKQRLKRNFKEGFRFFIFVILPMLLIAGIIEGILVGIWG
jgi:stage II sporulation protein M